MDFLKKIEIGCPNQGGSCAIRNKVSRMRYRIYKILKDDTCLGKETMERTQRPGQLMSLLFSPIILHFFHPHQ